jgi:hypothetical protein
MKEEEEDDDEDGDFLKRRNNGTRAHARTHTTAIKHAPPSITSQIRNFWASGQDVLTLGLSGAVSAGYMTACAMEGYGELANVLLQREIVTDFGYKKIY